MPAATDIEAMAMEDFALDGRAVLVTADSDGILRFLADDGAGGFAETTWPAVTSGDYFLDLAATDMDADGRPDLVTGGVDRTTLTGNSSVLLGGPGGVAAASGGPFDHGEWPTTITVGDYDDDGHVDVIGSRGFVSGLGLLRGVGGGALGPATVLALPQRALALATEDMDGDGDDDVVTALAPSFAMAVLLNHGDGTFAAPLITPMDADLVGFATADFDGDGDTDVAYVSGTAPHHVHLMRNDGHGTLGAPEPGIAVGSVSDLSTAGDVNRDGHADLVAATHDRRVVVLLGDGSGTFTLSGELQLPASTTLPREVLVADVNGDDRPDIVAGGRGAGALGIYRNQGRMTAAFNAADGELGTLAIGETLRRTVTLRSTGELPLATAAVTAHGDGVSITGETCSHRVLEIDSTCTVEFAVTPSAAGPLSGELRVAGADAPVVLPLTAIATESASPPPTPDPPTDDPSAPEPEGPPSAPIGPDSGAAPPPIAPYVCRSRRELRVTLPRALRGTRVRLVVNGRRVLVHEHAPRKVTIDLTGRPKQTARVVITNGTTRITRSYRTCVPRRGANRHAWRQ